MATKILLGLGVCVVAVTLAVVLVPSLSLAGVLEWMTTSRSGCG